MHDRVDCDYHIAEQKVVAVSFDFLRVKCLDESVKLRLEVEPVHCGEEEAKEEDGDVLEPLLELLLENEFFKLRFAEILLSIVANFDPDEHRASVRILAIRFFDHLVPR